MVCLTWFYSARQSGKHHWRKLRSCLSTVWDRAENTQESCSRCTSLIEAGAAHSVTCQPRETCEISRIFSTLGTLIFQNHPNLSKKISLPRLPEAIHHYFQGVQMIRLSLSLLNSSSSVLSAPYEEIFNLNATCCVASACAASIFYSGALSTS